MKTLHLTKHHGLGNDFLVLIDMEDRYRLGRAAWRALCDRHRGVGADGFIRVMPGADGSDLRMELHNSDGSEAETSGNGLRCLAQAVLDAELVDHTSFTVMTGAGRRTVTVRPGGDDRTVLVTVAMGVARVGQPVAQRGGSERAVTVDVGNPHVVYLIPDPSALDVAMDGPAIEATYEGGINVEFASLGPGVGEVTLRTWERGAGETQACGTGSTAAAAATQVWGLTGDKVVVHNPGGDLTVDLSGPEAILTGEAQWVASIEAALPEAARPEGALP